MQKVISQLWLHPWLFDAHLTQIMFLHYLKINVKIQ